MASLCWKRKQSTNIQCKSAALFNDDNEDNEKEEVGDWMSLLPGKKSKLEEDGDSKSARLMEEGIILAEEQRYWEAIGRFDDALSYKRSEAKLYEMKAQALLELNELYPAVEAAEKAVQINPLWAQAYQTLGRTQISFGDIKMAIHSFCIALHLRPDLQELYQEDLPWAIDLREKEEKLKENLLASDKDKEVTNDLPSGEKEKGITNDVVLPGEEGLTNVAVPEETHHVVRCCCSHKTKKDETQAKLNIMEPS